MVQSGRQMQRWWARRITRRRLLQGTALGAAGLATAAILGCDGDGNGVPDGNGLTGPLNFSNWPFYIDEETNGDFQSEFGVSVNYNEDINDNEEFFAIVQPQLSRGEDTGRDIIVLTDWIVPRFINQGWLEELDKSNIPNWENLNDPLKEVAFDPGRRYSLVWQSGFTGLGYNPTLTGREITKIEDIFDPAFAGKVTMLTEMRDTLGLVMLTLGIDPEQATVDDARRTVEKIQQFIDNGHIRTFTGNDYGDELALGNSWVAIAWSGDVIQLQLDNPDLQWVFPEEGFHLWSDNMMIPKGARNKATAEAYMNFVYRPEIAAQIAAFVQFIPPVKADLVRPEIERFEEEPGELVNNPLIFPDDELLARAFQFKPLEPEEELEFIELFNSLEGIGL